MDNKISKRHGPWKPGQSGNPAGRPKGVRDRRTILRQMLEPELPAILRKLVEQAKDGDASAAGLLLSRAYPPLRPVREPVSIPGMREAQTPADLARCVVRAAGEAALSPDVASELIGAIAGVQRVVEIDELERRIAALEQQA